MEKNKMGIFVAVLVLVAGGSFFGGMTYGKNSATAARQAQFAQRGFTGGAGGANARQNLLRMNGGGASGEVLSKDDTSITVKMRDGGSRIIFVSGSTQVMKAAAGSLGDVAVGEQVTAMGPANADGSINAQMIQIRPAGLASTTPANIQK